MRRRIFLSGALLVLACRPKQATEVPVSDDTLVVFVVRHAEKVVEEGLEDPPLTDVGAARAAALPSALPVDTLVAIYSTRTKRTQATVDPLARATGLPIRPYAAKDYTALLDRIREHGAGGVVVAGHSNTIPDMLGAFGVAEPVSIDDDQYGDVFQVRLSPGAVTLQVGAFGPTRTE